MARGMEVKRRSNDERNVFSFLVYTYRIAGEDAESSRECSRWPQYGCSNPESHGGLVTSSSLHNDKDFGNNDH